MTEPDRQEEITRLPAEDRARKLALEKSYLQLVIRMMSRVGSAGSLDDVVESLLRNILDVIGGTNITLYYTIDQQLLVADVYGRRESLVSPDDPLVLRVFESGEPLERESAFADSAMQTQEFGNAYSWFYPVKMGSLVIGVFRMENLNLAMRDLGGHLPLFFNYAGLVINNEIHSQSRLQQAYTQLTVTNRELCDSNARLAEEIRQRSAVESSLRITQFAVDHASDCLFWIRSDASFANVNDSTCQRLGYSREELLALSVFDVDPAFPREAWDSHWREIQERKFFTIETKHRTKSGEVFPVEVTLNYVEFEGAEYNFAFARDITERKRAEESLKTSKAGLEDTVLARTAELRQANERLQLELEQRARVEKALKLTQFAMDSTADAVFWLREDGSYFYANKAASDLLGYTAGEFRKMRVADVNPEHRDDAWQRHWRELKEQLVLRFESALSRKDGSQVPVEITANYVEFEDQAYNCAFVRDISEHVQARIYGDMGRDILHVLNEPGALLPAMRQIITILKTGTGFEAVGIRLQDGDDFPYFAQDGFPEDFLRTENTLLARDAAGGICRDPDGKVCLECTCGQVISAKTDPASPYVTKGGSCWTNDKAGSPFIDTRLHPRDRCLHEGFQSVALVPVRTNEKIVGLIQLNDRRKGRLSLTKVELLEGIASHISSALLRKQAEEELRRSSREWSAAMDASEDVIYLLGLDRRLIRANKAFYRLTGSTPETASGRHIVELMHPEGEQVPCPVCVAQEEMLDTVLTMEAWHPHNPTNRPIEITLRIVRDDEGRPISMFMTLHDLSHERTVQAELAKYREHLEELVKERTAEVEKKNAELERMNKLFVGRELRMVELKERIKELERKS